MTQTVIYIILLKYGSIIYEYVENSQIYANEKLKTQFIYISVSNRKSTEHRAFRILYFAFTFYKCCMEALSVREAGI